MKYLVNMSLIVIYVLCGAMLEQITKIPAVFAFYGYLMALLTLAVNIIIGESKK